MESLKFLCENLLNLALTTNDAIDFILETEEEHKEEKGIIAVRQQQIQFDAFFNSAVISLKISFHPADSSKHLFSQS